MANKMTEYPNIDTWSREPEESYAYSDGKNLILNIEKILPMSLSRMSDKEKEGILHLKTFIIDRKLFYKKTDLIAQYVDYFTEFFDEDKELPLAYLSIKEAIDSSHKSMTPLEFLKTLMEKFFTGTAVKRNIYKMVSANYNLDVTIDPKTGRSFNGIYDFTNDEAKILLAISVFMKFTIPITSQYINTNTMISDDELSDLVTDVFVESFYRMGNYYGVDVDELLVKLYMFTEKKIAKHYGLNQLLWNQQCALRGLTESMHVDTILIKHLLANNMFKFRFDESIINFMKSIVETQLICTINRLKYKANPVRIDNDKDYNGLTGTDKLYQSMSKMDESSVIRCAKSIEYEINLLTKELGEISDEEHDWYYNHYVTTEEFHKMMVDYFYAGVFGGFLECKNVSSDQYVDLMIWCKRKLIRDGYKELPYLISSNLKGRMSQRLLQNSRYITKYQSSSTYKNMMENTYSCIDPKEDDPVLSIISKVINNIFTYNEYDDQEKTGEVIEFNEDVISDEIMNFIDNI